MASNFPLIGWELKTKWWRHHRQYVEDVRLCWMRALCVINLPHLKHYLDIFTGHSFGWKDLWRGNKIKHGIEDVFYAKVFYDESKCFVDLERKRIKKDMDTNCRNMLHELIKLRGTEVYKKCYVHEMYVFQDVYLMNSIFSGRYLIHQKHVE